MLDMAMEILQCLDKGNKTIMRCRDTLAQLLTAYDFDGMEHLVVHIRGMADSGSTLTGHAAGFTPDPFSLSPTSAWAWQLMDPGLLGSELAYDLEPEAFGTTWQV